MFWFVHNLNLKFLHKPLFTLDKQKQENFTKCYLQVLKDTDDKTVIPDSHGTADGLLQLIITCVSTRYKRLNLFDKSKINPGEIHSINSSKCCQQDI